MTVASLPEERKAYEITDSTDENGIRHIDAVAEVNGIGEADLLLDASGLSQEDIHWAVLYTRLIGELDTQKHSREELMKLTTQYIYDGGIELVTYRDQESGWKPWLELKWMGLDEDMDMGYDLSYEILYETSFDDLGRIRDKVGALIAGVKNFILANSDSIMIYRAFSITDEKSRYHIWTSYLAYYDFLLQTEKLLEKEPDTVIEKLKGIQEFFHNRAGAVSIFAGNEQSIALNRKEAERFLSSLDFRETSPVAYDLPVPSTREALIIDIGAQHNILASTYSAMGVEGFTGDMRAVANVVTDALLMPLLRDRYGVYGPIVNAREGKETGIVIEAYRDPNIAETFQVLDQLPDMIAELSMDQETLDGYILNAYSDYAKPEGALSGAFNAAIATLEGESLDQKLEFMRQLKTLTPEKLNQYSELFEKLIRNGIRITVGSASAIYAHEELFDAIYNPFGAVDKTTVAFTDLEEGDALYEAVRFAFEKGLMDAREESSFGVQAPATYGDLYTAVYVMTGGNAGDAAAAQAELAAYGLTDPEADLNAAITPDQVWAMFSALMGQRTEPLTAAAQPDTITRGELAEALLAFMSSLEQ